MKRRLLCLALSAVLCLTVLPGAVSATFADIADPDEAVAAACLESMGVFSGTAEGVFSPNAGLTRAQLCKIVVELTGHGGKAAAYAKKTRFTDVSSSAWYNAYVNYACAEGLVNGYGDGTFGPNDPVTYGQAATILLRLLGYTDVGTVWPQDYTARAEALGLNGGLTLGDYEALTRGEAAILLYQTLLTAPSGGTDAYYRTREGVASTQRALLLDSTGTQVTVCNVEGESGIYTYRQSYDTGSSLAGYLGTLLFDGSGTVVGFVPDDSGWTDFTVSSATAAAVTAADGTSYRVGTNTVVLAGGEVLSYAAGGYLELRAGSTVRLYTGDDGTAAYVWLGSGTAASTEAAVATSSDPADTLCSALGARSDCTFTKNGAAATEDALALWDVAYYDTASNTIRASDYRITGYLTAASPSMTAAQTVTIAGCTLDVLSCAWDTLGTFSAGQRVTLLLTDDCKVAAAYAPGTLTAQMIGVLSRDGSTVTLCGSNLTLTAQTINAQPAQYGALVNVSQADAETLRCTATSGVQDGTLDLTARTLGTLSLAPSCAIYEWTGSGYVSSLEGEVGAASSDFSDIPWTDTLSDSTIAYSHTNDAGQIDILLLEDVTGNCYAYGALTRYTGRDGVNLGSGNLSAYNSAITLTNADGTSDKAIYTSTVDDYGGVAYGAQSRTQEKVVSVAELTKITGIHSSDFYRQDGAWYVLADGERWRVADNIQVYFSAAGNWLSGEAGLAAALADGTTLTLYCDRTADTGGQIRILLPS